MKVPYKCKCMSEEAHVDVQERAPGTDLMHWMDTILHPALTADHYKRSPTCYAGRMDYVKIPIDEATGFVGKELKGPPHA